MNRKGYLTGGKIPDHQFNEIMLQVPAFTYEQLMPQLTHHGFKFCLYKGNSFNAPIEKIGVYTNDVDKIIPLTENRFRVERMPNLGEIFITIK